jgi:hypothetical protein
LRVIAVGLVGGGWLVVFASGLVDGHWGVILAGWLVDGAGKSSARPAVATASLRLNPADEEVKQFLERLEKMNV